MNAAQITTDALAAPPFTSGKKTAHMPNRPCAPNKALLPRETARGRTTQKRCVTPTMKAVWRLLLLYVEPLRSATAAWPVESVPDAASK